MSTSAPLTIERLRSQLLVCAPATAVLDVAQRLLCVQGQDFRGVRLAIRARSVGLHSEDVHVALTDARSVLITWLNRGTLHLVCAEDYWWLHPLTTPQLATANARRLAEEGVSPSATERGVAAIKRALAADGPLLRRQLRERVAAAGVPVAGQALVHLLLQSSLRGTVVRGPVIGNEQAFVLVEDWLGSPPPPVDRDVALAELASRYLCGHGPASERDLARWAGLPLGQARRAMAAIGHLLQDRDDGLLALRSAAAAPGERTRLPKPLLLGAFDPLLLGWTSREDVVGEHRSLVTSNGLFRPFLFVRGRARGTWSINANKVSMTPFEALSDADLRALERDARAVEAFLAPVSP